MDTPHIIITILTTLILLPWPLVLMFSPMMFDAPGSDENIPHVLMVIVIVFYPLWIFLFYWFMGWSLWGISSKTLSGYFFIGLVVVPGIIFILNLPESIRSKKARSGYKIKDNKVYYAGNEIDGANSPTFEILYGKPGDEGKYWAYYAKDKTRVYYEGRPVRDAEPKRFSCIISRPEVKDKYINNDFELWADTCNIFVHGKKLQDANPDRFEYLGEFFWRDKKYVYYYYERLDGAEPDGAFVVGNIYLKTKNGVYFKETAFPVVDVDSWDVVRDCFSRDKNRIYYCSNPVNSSVDPESFKLILDDSMPYVTYAKDKKHVYVFSSDDKFITLVGINPKTFTFCGNGYIQDNGIIFYINQEKNIIRVQADVESFKSEEIDYHLEIDASDKEGYFFHGMRNKHIKDRL